MKRIENISWNLRLGYFPCQDMCHVDAANDCGVNEVF